MTSGNYRSTLGGACSAAGTTLMGIGVMSQFNGANSSLIRWVTLSGFILTAAGQFFGHLFAADAKQVSTLTDLVNANTQALQTGNTDILSRVAAANPLPK